jgi:hypothetical protein
MSADLPAEWTVDEAGYPAGGTVRDQLRFLVRYAILAPSGHNTQPWLFRVGADHVDIVADRTRCLPVVDPHDRALVISCGAAAGALDLAMRHFGLGPANDYLPDAGDPDVLVRVRPIGSVSPTPADQARFRAIRRRRTTRLRYPSVPLPSGLAAELGGIAEAHGIELALVRDEETKAGVAALVAEGDRIQFSNPAFRRELGSWVHSRRAATRDGMSGANFGMPDILSGVGGLVIRTFDIGNGVGAKDRDLASGSPALLVVSTPGDGAADWLRAGMAHMEMLLAVTAAGLTAAYLNQPVEVDALRPRLREAVGARGTPQLLLRIGRAALVPPAVRRPVETVIEEVD